MLKVKKEYDGKVQVTVDGRTVVLDENTPQEDLEIFAKDVNAGAFIEKVKEVKPSEALKNTKQ